MLLLTTFLFVKTGMVAYKSQILKIILVLVKKIPANRKSCKGNYDDGLTINNLNKFVIRYFEDQVLSGLKPNSDKTVTNPALRLGLVSTHHTWTLVLMALQREVVHGIYCQSLRRILTLTLIRHYSRIQAAF
ncbi:MAG: hypothetical protein HYV59_00660 [Planctomycetes bacterium]|nr:hypothetical protein [Planctomycetota bacterium]